MHFIFEMSTVDLIDSDFCLMVIAKLTVEDITDFEGEVSFGMQGNLTTVLRLLILIEENSKGIVLDLSF